MGNRLATASGVLAPARLPVAGGDIRSPGRAKGLGWGHELRAAPPDSSPGLIRCEAQRHSEQGAD